MEAIPSYLQRSIPDAINQSVSLLFSHQDALQGYWWYTLEANETIGAGFIQLMHFLGDVDLTIQDGLAKRILLEQREDGSWALFFKGPGDLSTTIECYLALRLTELSPEEPALKKARDFIFRHGGLTKARVFTRIHLALFGLIPWSACPAMPVWFVLLPHWLGISIYEFSSWARASIVPLLLIGAKKPVRPIAFDLDELFAEPEGQRNFRFPRRNFFALLDSILKRLEKFPWHPGRKIAIRKAEQWTREHIARTEDIYPAMAYAAIAISALGHPANDPTIRKALNGLRRFRQHYTTDGVFFSLHQQCCISPNWDTPWAGVALIEAGVDRRDPRLLKAARYMLDKEIRNFCGDWRFKNPKGPAGGWAFEFQNDFFPDVDDTIEALFFLKKVGLPDNEKEGAIRRGCAWLLSMQSKNGGWAAFDKNNLSNWVNRIPFSDHGACLDPPTPDVTGRMTELLSLFGYTSKDSVVARALSFLKKTEESSGGWRGRWGVNYIYGTWCVLQGFRAIGQPPGQKATLWLQSIQNKDGGWGESCLSDTQNGYVPIGVSVPSQTAWAVLALMAGGQRDSDSVQQGIQWLIENQKDGGGWLEPYHTGTGFPGHFYLRYHGYRYYFPLLALGRFQNLTQLCR